MMHRPRSLVPTGGSRQMGTGGTLLVASTGGHLEQLYRLHRRFSPTLEDVEWATFDTPQARHLLADEVVTYVPMVAPKDVRHAVVNLEHARRLLGSGRFARVISTGAAVAVPFIAVARAMGLETHYIESAARSAAPSLSGRMVSRLPRVNLYAQYPRWTGGRWQYRGAVFDGFAPGPPRPVGPLGRVVVTFGTQRGFGFRRAVDRLLVVLPELCAPDVSILWQTGATDVSGLGIAAHERVPARDLEAAVADADLVVAHAGIGSALLALEQGRCPVLLPRRHGFGEHTDDHQRFIAAELAQRRLAVSAEADLITAPELASAARMSAVALSAVRPFVLQTG